ncbi:bifunctional serine/threonine-protein kinase/ABC transporter substrate-binding protein [Crocosphaera sp.]|uniref:bifunctional serine/threonine-protein kinase/ABC transporter substrate-binding protein n=1 Tax=Crocosphaera sp. TaxID=2729996 RepID=UPI00261AEE89|nr:bifunctional serine/threonine-protein kinase/ABC transporter substrate-binding protein [Crocosphaera sp.]MDJ0582556.1 bifunctional serine/threonine-protein kinase/ABC transporter substrate-binding protein [Crocosphaera sp.]
MCLINNRYKIIDLLGSGAFGETHLAEDTDNHNERVVVKRLKSEIFSACYLQKVKELFTREDQALRKLGENNSCIPQQKDFFKDDNKDCYLIMEYIEGNNLNKQELREGNKLPETEVINLLCEVLKILAVVHSDNLIHRDIKPENIIRRTNNKQLVLIDFGCVTERQNREISEGQKNTVIGTYPYASPEQLNIEGKINFCSDIYAVGMIGIQSLIGRCPENLNDPNNGEIAWEHLSSASRDLKKVIRKMVNSDSHKRYQTVTEVLQALQRIQENNIFNIFKRSSILPFCFGISIGICIGAFGYVRLFQSTISKPIEENTELANVDNFANQFLTKCENKINPEQEIIRQNEKAELKRKKRKIKIIRIAVMIPGQGTEECSQNEIISYSLESLRGIADSQEKLLPSNNSELIQIVIVNYDNDDNKAEYLAKEIANDTSIMGVIVVGSSSNNKKVLDVIEKYKKLVMITPTASATTLGKDSFNFHRTNSSDLNTAKKIANKVKELLKKDKSKKVAIFYSSEKGSSSYSSLLKDDLIKFLEKDEVIPIDVKTKRDEYEQLKNKNVGAMILLPEFDNIDWAIDLIKRNSSSYKLPILGGDTLYQGIVIANAGEAAKGIIISAPWAYSPNSCGLGKKWGPISWRTATTYDALQAFVHAIKALEGKNINRGSIHQKIKEVNLSNENCQTSGKLLRFFDDSGQKIDREPDLVEITDDKEKCQGRQYPKTGLCYAKLYNEN